VPEEEFAIAVGGDHDVHHVLAREIGFPAQVGHG